jgi:copper oxidase (laccase) domain-containing protein
MNLRGRLRPPRRSPTKVYNGIMISKDQPTIFDKAKVSVAVSSVAEGNTKPEWSPRAETEQAIAKLAGAIGLDLTHVVVMNVGAHQDAWDEIVDVTSSEGRGVTNPDERIAADALVTNMPSVALLLPVADCNAVAIHDPVKNVLAVVHLGWQSTVAELATKVVQHLQQKYQSSATDLRIYFSPAIKAESYVFDKVSQDGDPAWKDFLHKAELGTGVDLPGYNRQRFIDAGVPSEQIEVSPINTATSDNYYSHYRSVRSGEPEGRFALLASLKG